MSTISYLPSQDKLQLRLRPLKGKATKRLGRFKLWLDDEGYIDGLDITRYREASREFKRALSAVRLGGIWKGLRVTEEDIKQIREELLGKLEDRW